MNHASMKHLSNLIKNGWIKSAQELIESALAQPEHPLDKKADNARELGLDYEPEQEPDGYALVPIKPTKVMLDAMDGCSREGYGEPLLAGHAASVYYAALNAASLSARQDPENESRSKQEAIAWIPEDELPDSYPYDLMYQYSKIDMIRLFPVYEPSQRPDGEIKL